jgi:hypothetical protein
MPGVLRPLLRKRLILGLAGAAAVLLAVVPARTLASCVAPPPIIESIAKADVVFVGTVTTTAEHNLWATVTVEEVWKGPDLPAVFQVRGGEGGNVATSVDREFTPGTTYLFVPFEMDSGFASDNSCSPTRPWDQTLVELRPANARSPIGGTPPPPAEFDLAGAIAPIGVALLVAGLLVIVGLAARSRRAG